MAKRMLIPLDGTAASEAILRQVSDAARGAGAVARLLHVEPIPGRVVRTDGRVVSYENPEMARLEAQWLSYLASAAVDVSDIPIESVVRFGDPASEILREADAWSADLIAMAPTRRGRLARLFRRGVADRVLRRADVPVLLWFPRRRAIAESSEILSSRH